MKFALVHGQRQEAAPDLLGACPACAQSMVAKCGEQRMRHWAHKGKRQCDPWWENEGEWHRQWKAQFPESWQEVVHQADGGERHIADVKTERGWVIELQHSSISPDERRSRDSFYGRICWVVDGTRRKRDASQFLQAWTEGARIAETPLVCVRQLNPADCALLREWCGSPAPVFFDFGDGQVLGWLLRDRRDGLVYVARILRVAFIEAHSAKVAQKGTDFDEISKALGGLVTDYETRRQAQMRNSVQRQLASRGIRRLRF